MKQSELLILHCQLIQSGRIGKNANADAFQVRNIFMQFFNLLFGAISWQTNHISIRLHEYDH